MGQGLKDRGGWGETQGDERRVRGGVVCSPQGTAVLVCCGDGADSTERKCCMSAWLPVCWEACGPAVGVLACAQSRQGVGLWWATLLTHIVTLLSSLF